MKTIGLLHQSPTESSHLIRKQSNEWKTIGVMTIGVMVIGVIGVMTKHTYLATASGLSTEGERAPPGGEGQERRTRRKG